MQCHKSSNRSSPGINTSDNQQSSGIVNSSLSIQGRNKLSSSNKNPSAGSRSEADVKSIPPRHVASNVTSNQEQSATLEDKTQDVMKKSEANSSKMPSHIPHASAT
mmetsp:Transcript_18919/g.32560  ORF Transcript_18919/g.32560 Transcript_18919/m.32560 type:complete len:106 (+) Transcript_18919:1018-1335(+)